MSINTDLWNILEIRINRRKREIIDFLQESIQTPSVSGQEGDYAELIAEKMRALGYDKVNIDGAGNILGTINGDKSGKTLLYNGHIDHVPPGKMEEPYSAKVIDGTPFGINGDIIWGRAAADMKGALAGMVMAGGILKEAEISLKGDLIVTGVVMEELLAHTGAKYLIEQNNIRADAAVIGEATNLNISLGHRSNADIQIQSRGKMAHGSAPERGINAFSKIIPLIQELQTLEEKVPKHPILGKPTLPVTMVSVYPDVINVIPELCTLHVNFRGHPNYHVEEFLADLRTIITILQQQDPELVLECQLTTGEERSYSGYLEIANRHMYSFYTNPAEPIVGMTEQIVEFITTMKPELTTWTFATDGGFISQVAKIPTIGFGPGEERFTHSPNDLISIQDVLTATKVYTTLAPIFSGVIET